MSNPDNKGKLNNETSFYLEVNKPCPEFVLRNIDYFTLRKAKLNDFKGKWLVLDFWNSNCISCIESFPKINDLRTQFSDKVEFVLIGLEDTRIRAIYRKYQEYYKLNIPVVFDSVLYKDVFRVSGAPYIVVIDTAGIVKSITSKITRKDIEDFIAGRVPNLESALNKVQEDSLTAIFDYTKPFLVNGNGGNDTNFLYRSLLAKWQYGMNVGGHATHFFLSRPNEALFRNTPLKRLYQIAYGDTLPNIPVVFWEPNTYGKYWIEPILEVKDTMPFYLSESLMNSFYYDLIVPILKASKGYMQKLMQRDLRNYFGYEVNLERRNMPCWLLTVDPGSKEKLKTKGGKKFRSQETLTGVKFGNIPIEQLISYIWSYHQHELPIINDTKIEGNIDLELNCIETDFTEIIKALKINGLNLKKGRKEMYVIVIRDSK